MEYAETYISFLNGLIGSMVGPIYAPTAIDVWCKGGHATVDVPVDPDRWQAQRTADPATYAAVMQDLGAPSR